MPLKFILISNGFDVSLPGTGSPELENHVSSSYGTPTNIQGDSGGKVNILGGDSIGHCEKKSSYGHASD
jgi:hypothetical protein